MLREINLLPPSLRHKRARRVYLGRVGRLLVRVCVLLGIMVAAQAAGLAVFSTTLKEVETRARIDGASPLESVLREVMSANEVLSSFRERVDKEISWTGYLGDVFALLNKTVVITGLGVEEGTRQLTISGTTDSRSAVAALRKDLSELPWVAAVDAPLENFTVSNEITFTLHLQLN